MTIHNYGRLIFLSVAFVCVTALLATNRIDDGIGVGMLGTIVGYVVGDGVGAITKTAPSPIVTPHLADGMVATPGGPARLQRVDSHGDDLPPDDAATALEDLRGDPHA